MASTSDEQPLQAFLARSTEEVIKIPAVMDPKAQSYIVLWEDIQRVFENPKFIKNKESFVPFLKNDNFEVLNPLRIAYHPGIVLEVISGLSTRVDSFREPPHHIETASPSEEPKSFSKTVSSVVLAESNTDRDLSSSSGITTFAISDVGIEENSLHMRSQEMPAETQLSLREYNQLFSSYFKAIASGQEVQAAGIKQVMGHHFDRLLDEMDKNKDLQEQLVLIQKQMHEKQDHILKIQQQTVDHVTLIQSRIQALLVQTYELHEFPTPRLFIVLPVKTRLRDKLKKPFSNQFRLYFLCECGAHTMSNDDKTLHEVHLARHGGYVLDKPTEFFEKFGHYVLALLYMVKYGIIAAGLVVPPLANFKVVAGLDTAQENLKYLKSNIGQLVDDAIDAVQDARDKNGTKAGLADDGKDFDKLEALEGADLRHLESYLEVKDQGRALGNLYRIVTQEGHVKWVCFDHYRANYRLSSTQFLQDVVEIHGGTFIAEIGSIEIKVPSSIIARQFYDVLIRARGIQELNITLEWDASMDDLRALCNAVNNANVIRLTVNGAHLEGPTLDLVNRGRRFDPILQLGSNGRVQSLRLKGFEDFFLRVSNSSLVSRHWIRTFSIETEFPLKDKAMKSFQSFLEHCQALTQLELKSNDLYLISTAIMDLVGKIHGFKSLSIDCGRLSVITNFSEGNVKDVTVKIPRLSDLKSDDITFIRQCHLTHLDISYTPQTRDEDRLVDILQHCPALKHLRVGCLATRSYAITKLVISTREKTLQELGSTGLKIFDLMEEQLVPFIYAEISDGKTHIQSRVAFKSDSASFEMAAYVELKNDELITDGDPHLEWVTWMRFSSGCKAMLRSY
ncbi:hypothetical protein BGZ99_008279 [Dissophora globulifera]|uniref:Uncharacterized protein n=1 Tax=Dissophora globulifera TaxID=979702 RepID=A0A9P6RBP8_9FUNG|nr:hypothetical protein BGZ99_008279 [Dissophora globulifera]